MSKINQVAVSEVLGIINNMSIENQNKIPSSFLKFLKENSLSDYDSQIDFSKELKENKLSPDTLTYLYLIFTKFFCTSSERVKFEEEIELLRKEQEYINRERYNPDNVFDNDCKHKVVKNEESLVVKVEKDSLLKRIFIKIKNFFEK